MKKIYIVLIDPDNSDPETYAFLELFDAIQYADEVREEYLQGRMDYYFEDEIPINSGWKYYFYMDDVIYIRVTEEILQ